MSSLVQKENDELVIDLKSVFQLLWQKLPIILISMVGCGVIAFLIAYFLVTPQYKASVTLYVNNRNTQESTTTLTQNDLTASAKLVDTFSAIITSKTMLKDVAARAAINMEDYGNSYETLKKKMTIEAVNSSEVFTVAVTNPDAGTAQRIVNAVAELLPEKIAGLIEGCSVHTVDYADVPDKIDSPSYLIWTVVGVMLGILVSVAFVIIVGINDTRIKSEKDLEEWAYPILSVIPDLDPKTNSTKAGYGYK